MTRIHANNFITSLNGAVSSSATSIILTSVTGFPAIGAGVTCNVTLSNGADIEIATATAISSFTLTVTRGAEGTVAKAFASGSIVSIRPTAGSFDGKADLASPTFTGTVTIPTPFTLGAVSVLPTGTELNFVDGVTSNIQTQIDSKITGGTLGANVNTFLVTPSSANLLAAVTDETGTGALVFANTPTLVTPILGTITSGDLSAGTGSLVNLTTVTTSADSTFHGVKVGQGAGSVGSNTVCGSGLTSNTTGSAGTAFGTSALAANTTGDYNNAMGYVALAACTTGGANNAMGATALIALTTGSYNVAIGSGALTTPTTGNYNTGIGYGTNVNNVAAIGCLALGANATADIATGTGSGDIGPGIAIGSAGQSVGFAGDGSIIQTAGSSVGYWRVKLNGTYYKFLMLADS